MSPQMACLARNIVTLAAFMRFLPRVSFQMIHLRNFPNRSKDTLAAFVRFLSRVRFQMFPQISCWNRGIITLFAPVRFFSRVSFQVCPQSSFPNRLPASLACGRASRLGTPTNPALYVYLWLDFVVISDNWWKVWIRSMMKIRDGSPLGSFPIRSVGGAGLTLTGCNNLCSKMSTQYSR